MRGDGNGRERERGKKGIGKQSGESGESVLKKKRKAVDLQKRKVLSLD